MIFKTGIKHFLGVSLILLWCFTDSSWVLGARVAGEKGTSGVASESEQTVQAPAEPSGKNLSGPRPARKKSTGTDETSAGNVMPARKKNTTKKDKDPEKSFSIDFHNVDIATFINFVS